MVQVTIPEICFLAYSITACTIALCMSAFISSYIYRYRIGQPSAHPTQLYIEIYK